MIYLAYFWSLMRHKWFVFVAGLRLGGIPLWRLIIHDWGKFRLWEYGRYARYSAAMKRKQKNGEPIPDEIQDGFNYAWLHHEGVHPHHWGYWIPRSGKLRGRPLSMPNVFMREMVADWMGASRAYTGSWDMSEWLKKNLAGIEANMHSDSVAWVHVILSSAGYGEVVDALVYESLGSVLK